MKKGQALVEFIIILPIFLIIFLGIVDISNISLSKINLENRLSEVIDSYDNNIDTMQKQLAKEDIKLEVVDGDYLTFKLTKEITIITPGLNLIFKNPYQISTSRSIKDV